MNPIFSHIKFLFFLLIFSIVLVSQAFATNFVITVEDASTADVSSGTADVEIIYVRVSNGNGSGQANGTITGMSFSPDNTDNADITAARLYLTTSTTFSTGTQLGSDDTDLSNGISFTFSQTVPKGNTKYYFWLAYDLSASATDCNTIDAYQVSADITTVETISSYTDNATGYRLIGPGLGCWSYCSASGSNDVWGWVDRVQFESIDNTTGTNNGWLDATAQTTTVYKGYSYTLTITTYDDYAGGPSIYTAAWIDFNNDGDFADSGEKVAANATNSSTATGTYTRTITVSIPATATTGDTRMRIMAKDAAPPSDGCGTYTYQETEDYTIAIDTATNMIYLSSTTTQSNTTDVNAGTYDREVIGIEVVMDAGVLNPLSTGTFNFNTTGTTDAANDIQNGILWSTGTSPTFATGTQVGSTVASTNGAFSITPSVVLNAGTNYFWLTYDVVTAATGSNQIDAVCSSITVDGTPYTPSVTDPGSGRTINAATTMTYVSSTVEQNSSPVPKGSAKNHVVGIEIVVSGALTPLDVTSISITEGCTNASGDIENCMIWFSGLSDAFATSNQFGSTVTAPSGSFTITGTETLLNGTNYFWLSYDTKAAATGGNTIDASVTSITIGGSAETPTVTAPLGSREIVSNAPYYSQGSLDAATLSSWNSERDGSGSAPGSFSSSYSFWIQDGHSMTTSSTVTIPYLYIEDGGYVTASYLISLTELRILSGGTFEQTKNASNASYITSFYIENDGTWIHNNSGYLPGDNRYFSPNSNQWFEQWGGGTFPSGTAWGNVLFNGTTIGNFDLRNVMNTIQGDWEWRRIGTNNYLWDGDTETLDVGGDLIFTGGWFAGVGDGAGGIGPPAPNNNTSTVNVTGDFIMSDGEFDDYVSGNSSALTILTIGGNIEITGGIWNFDKATGGDSQINLDGGTASVTWEQTGGTVTLCNTFIKSGKTVTLSGTTMGDIESGRSIDVQSGGRLNCSTYPVEGAGAFDLQSGGTLGIGSADGITDAAASGNVQVAGTRTYSSLANYVYNGTSAQVTNVFTTTPTDTTVYTLTIDNTGSGVTLSDWDASMSGDLTVTSVLALDNGEFDLSSERIIVTNGATSGITRSAGYILSESESSIVRWEMDGTTGTDYTFPFGYSSTYIPFVFNKSTAAVDVELTTWHTATDNTPLPSGAGTPADPTNWVDRWWTIAAPSATAICDFAFTSAEESGLVNPDTIKHWNGAAYDEYTGTYSSASAISNSALSAWGPFSIGTGSTPLPIALGSFTGVSVDNGIQLEWTTFSELNNDYFEVETSEDGFANYYWTVGYVNGAGNSLEEINYSLMDKWPFFGLNYYRLRQVDNNGKQSVSKIIAVYYSGGETLHAYPTVAHDYVNIMFISSRQEDAVIYLYDMNGKVVLTQNITSMGKGVYYCTLDLTGLSASGMYTLVMEQGNHHRQTKIVKF